MSRRIVHRALLVALLLVLVSGAGAWWYMAIGRFPLAGNLSHDFGEVSFTGKTIKVSHTFQLRNRRGDPVVIESIIPGCGCTSAEASTLTVEPGGTVDIGISLGLDNAGKKRTHISLMIEGFGEQRLWVYATAKKEYALKTGTPQIRLTSASQKLFLFTFDVQSSDEKPAAPQIAVPEGVKATFLGWQPVRRRDEESLRAARWRGRIGLDLTTDGDLPDDAALRVTAASAPALTVPLSK